MYKKKCIHGSCGQGQSSGGKREIPGGSDHTEAGPRMWQRVPKQSCSGKVGSLREKTGK